ncbi:MAG: hypothetical protein H0V82_11895 [Candidatus Protochlamydia sp.]|nr:hypothetical protein [Candidatus Protochlamydia sp.]
MSYVECKIREFDSKMWLDVENKAISHPQTSRLCALPIAIVTLVRDTLANPARCGEEIVLTLKSLTAFKIDSHILYAVKYAILTPFSPFIGVVDAIISFIKVFISPLRTARINCAKQDFETLKEQDNIRSFMDLQFADAIFERFEKQVSSAPNVPAVQSNNFLRDDISKAKLIEEIALKNIRLNEADRIKNDKFNEIKNNFHLWHNGLRSLFNFVKLEVTWEMFKTELIHWTPTRIQIQRPPYEFHFEAS